MKKTIFEPNSLKFPTDEFYIKSTEEMYELFKIVPSAVANTAKIAEMCNVELEFGVTKLPAYTDESLKNMNGFDCKNQYFRDICDIGAVNRYGKIDETICERMEYEQKVIINMGYVDYFLIVWDFVKYAKEHNIPVGPGRGSGAGSVCAYCMGITDIDPIKYNLLFERFLNPERVSMPDFDIDFCIEGRQQVIDYVVKKYGEDKVSQIIAFDTLKARAAIKDTGRALGLSVKLRNDVSALIPRELDMTIKKALEKNDDLKKLYDSNPSAHRLIDESMKIEGMPRNDSIHAAGVVISAVPITELVPVKKSGDALVTQYTMTGLESLGLLKMDFLGLRNLTVIKRCVEQIRRNDPDFDINKINVCDTETFKMMSEGKTLGVFQFESDGMRRVLSQLKPENLEDLIAVISLYRPGPSESIPKYIRNKHAPDKIKYKHPILESILSVTYGCMVYQEQVMEICRTAAGYSYGRADLVRRAMAKKKHDVMENERKIFVYGDAESGCMGAVANGIDEKIANEIFDEMSGFAFYAFNKSHAAAYAYLAYQTAYLKRHYMKEYMAALMSSIFGNSDKLAEYAEECRKYKINILRPDINRSFCGFTAEPEGIRYGLLAIKNIGKGVIDSIAAEREVNGNFTSLDNFCERTAKLRIGKLIVEYMIKSGCFDGFGESRRQMVTEYEYLMDSYSELSRSNIEGQMNLFQDNISPTNTVKNSGKKLPEYRYADLLEYERLSTGMYISGHPLENYRLAVRLMKMPSVTDIKKISVKNTETGFLGIIDDITIHYTSLGKKMAFLDVQDMTGSVSCTVFPDTYELYKSKLDHGKIAYFTGKVSPKEDYELSVICSHIYTEEEFCSIVEKKRFCVKVKSSDSKKMEKIIASALKYRGNTELCLYLTDMRKFIKLKAVAGVEICGNFIEDIEKNVNFGDIGFID